MAATARPSAAVPYAVLDPKSDRAANAAAHYVTQSRLTGFGFGAEDDLDDSRTHITSEVLGAGRGITTGRDFASAGAAASLAHSAQAFPRHGPQRSVSLREQKRPQRTLSRADTRLSSASSRAAFLAARESVPELAKSPEDAAVGARRDTTGLSRESTAEEEDPRAMAAATGAMNDSRRRAKTAPPIPDKQICRGQALTAAEACHRAYLDEELPLETIDESIDPERLHNTAIARTRRDLYRSYPYGGGGNEQDRQRSLHAAAVTLAQQLYAVMPRAEEMAAAEVSGFPPRGAEESDEAIRRRHLHFEAEKRANEQMAALNRDQKLAREADTLRARSLLPTRLKRRSVSEADVSTEGTRFGEAGGEDAFLMAAAQRNVNETLLGIDNDISMQTGKPTEEKKMQWQKIIRERSAGSKGSDYAAIGGTGFDDTDVRVTNLAESRVRPTLDDIDERVKKQKVSGLEKELDMEQKRRRASLAHRRETETMEALGQLKAFLRGSSTKKDKPKKEKKKKQKKDKKGKGKAVEEEPVIVPPPPPIQQEEEDYGYPNGIKEENRPPRSHIERERNGESSRSASESSLAGAAAQPVAPIPAVQRESEPEPVQEPAPAPKPSYASVLATAPEPEPEAAPQLQQQPAERVEAPASPAIKKRKSIRKAWFKTERRVATSAEESESQPAAAALGSQAVEGERIQGTTELQEEVSIEHEPQGDSRLRQWSTSDRGESPPASRKAKAQLGLGGGKEDEKKRLQGLPEEPEGQRPAMKREGSSGRFSFFKRTKSRRATSGSRSPGSFNVDKRSTWSDAQQGPDGASQEQSGLLTPPAASRRESKFQENL